MSAPSDLNSPMAKRKRHDCSTEQQQQQSESDELQSSQEDGIQIKTEINSLEIIDEHDAPDVSSTLPASPRSTSPSPDESSKMKIDDLPTKALVQIFEWLEFSDLLNVANATQKLCDAAGQVYAPNYARKLVKFHGTAISTNNIDETLTTFDINDARTCLLMFRAFGKFMEKLYLDLDGIGVRRMQAISDALNEYCGKTLMELELNHAPVDVSIEKFPKLTILRVSNSILGDKMTKFKEQFPMLHALELTGNATDNPKCIEHTFPKLGHLTVHIDTHKGRNFLKSNVKAAIQLNPQLRSLCIGSGCDPVLIKYIEEMLPLLKHLHIQQPRNKLFDSAVAPVRFERVRNLTLDIAECKDSFSNIPFRFDRLEKFVLYAAKQHRDKWIDFVAKHSKLVELHLLNFDWFLVVTKEQFEKIGQLSKLRRLILDWHIGDSDAFVQMLNDCTSLQEVRLTTRTQDERAAICSKLNTGWYMQIDRHALTLQRTKPNIDGDDEKEQSSN